jgi:hypothetical protein
MKIDKILSKIRHLSFQKSFRIDDLARRQRIPVK